MDLQAIEARLRDWHAGRNSELVEHAPEDIRALLDAVKELKALHRPYRDSSSVVETCGNCLQRYPCTTIRALGATE